MSCFFTQQCARISLNALSGASHVLCNNCDLLRCELESSGWFKWDVWELENPFRYNLGCWTKAIQFNSMICFGGFWGKTNIHVKYVQQKWCWMETRIKVLGSVLAAIASKTESPSFEDRVIAILWCICFTESPYFPFFAQQFWMKSSGRGRRCPGTPHKHRGCGRTMSCSKG